MLQILQGHVIDRLKDLPDQSVNCCVTSPPYWGLRDYGLEPVVWGGDLQHEHEWTSAGFLHKGGPQGKGGQRSNRDVSAQNTAQHIQVGDFCDCGAWRGSLGLEPTPDLFVEHIVEVFREVRRVLRDDGTLWLNMGDCYATGAGKVGEHPGGGKQGERRTGRDDSKGRGTPKRADGTGAYSYVGPMTQPNRMPQEGLKPKDLVGMPWAVAFALRADGWYLRSDIIWSKPNPMPESVTDRPTKSHEYIFLLSKSQKYYYDAEAIKESVTGGAHARGDGVNPKARAWKTPDGWDTSNGNGGHGSFHREGREKGQTGYQHKTRPRQNESFSAAVNELVDSRNKRTVWEIATQPYPEAHFATYPEKLIEPCILAGCPPRGIVLDCFAGSGTSGAVSLKLGRRAILIEANPAYVELIERRCQVTPNLLLAANGD